MGCSRNAGTGASFSYFAGSGSGTPALRAEVSPGPIGGAALPEALPAAAAPAGATPTAAGRGADPDEVTRTLASLADLRDRGAISAEEYEAKKTDLLGRL